MLCFPYIYLRHLYLLLLCFYAYVACNLHVSYATELEYFLIRYLGTCTLCKFCSLNVLSFTYSLILSYLILLVSPCQGCSSTR